MVFEREKIKPGITKLTQILDAYIKEEKSICVHIHLNDAAIRNCVVLEEIELSNQVVYLTGDDFVVNFEREIQQIEFSDYEESACIIFDQGKIYLDFINS